MFPNESTIEMSPEDLQKFAKQAKMTLEVVHETLLGLQSRLEYNARHVEKVDIVDLTYSLNFLIKGALNEGAEIPLY